MNVGRLFLRARSSNNIRKFITERAPRCSVVNHAEVIYYFWPSKRRNSINYTFNKNILCISILETFSLVRMFIITWLGLVKYFKNLNIYQYGNSYYRILCSKGEEWGRALYTAMDISPWNLVKLKKASCRKSIYCGLTYIFKNEGVFVCTYKLKKIWKNKGLNNISLERIWYWYDEVKFWLLLCFEISNKAYKHLSSVI